MGEMGEAKWKGLNSVDNSRFRGTWSGLGVTLNDLGALCSLGKLVCLMLCKINCTSSVMCGDSKLFSLSKFVRPILHAVLTQLRI